MGLRELPAYLVAPSKEFSVLAEQSDSSLVPTKATPLQEMSIVPHGTNDVRKRIEQGSVDEQGPARTDWVPLLSPVQGIDSKKPVFSCDTITDAEPSGLD